MSPINRYVSGDSIMDAECEKFSCKKYFMEIHKHQQREAHSSQIETLSERRN